MNFNMFCYGLRQSFINIKRNKMFSLASVCTIAICVFLLGIFYSLMTNFQHIVQNVQEQVGLTVFFDYSFYEEDVDTEAEIEKLRSVIEARDEVLRLEYISADEAWESIKDDYFKNNPELAEGFSDDNPLKKSASFEIYLKDLAVQDEFVKYLEDLDGIRQVNASDTSAEALTEVRRLVSYVSIAIIAILLCVGIFLISNTVVVGITVRKEEISIMKLIGSTDSFVRLPFIVEGVVIGLVGALIPLVIIYFAYEGVTNYVMQQFSGITTLITLVPLKTVYRVLVPMALIIGAGIGYLGSRISLRKHLQV